MVTFLNRVQYTFLKAHPHVKPALGGDEYKGWQVVNANVFGQFADDVIVYGIGMAVHNFRTGVRQLWESSREAEGTTARAANAGDCRWGSCET